MSDKPIRYTHSEVARVFADHYRETFKAIRTNRNTIEVWAKAVNRTDFELDVKRYHLRRMIRAYLDYLFTYSPEPKPLQLQSSNFLNCVMREVMGFIYTSEGL